MEDNRFASVGAIVLRGGDVLLVRHTYGGAAGMLLNPSGMIKDGEMPEDALKREIMEETGVEIQPRGILAIRCAPSNWWIIFLAHHVSGEPRSDNAENSEAFFMPCADAAAHPDITHATKTLIELALQKRELLTPNETYLQSPSAKDRVLYS